MPELNGGQLLARCLANEGVRFVFGLPSPEIDPLLAALDAHGIRLVPVRHEAVFILFIIRLAAGPCPRKCIRAHAGDHGRYGEYEGRVTPTWLGFPLQWLSPSRSPSRVDVARGAR